MADISDIRIPLAPVAPVRPPKRDGRRPPDRQPPRERRESPDADKGDGNQGEGPMIDEYARPRWHRPGTGYHG